MKYLHLFLIVICILVSSFAMYMVSNYHRESDACICSTHITAIVDNDKIINESLVLQNVRQQLEEQNSKLQKEFEKELEKFKPSKEEFDLLSEKAKREKEEQFNKYIVKAKDYYTKKMSDLGDNYRNAEDKILHKIREITKQIAENNKIDLVLFISKRNQVLYSKDNVDLSNEVLKNVNKAMPKFVLKAME